MTTDYTNLKGFSSFTDIDIANEVQQSVMMFFDWGFINKGAFTNVTLSSTDINSNNQSILRPVSDPNYTDGQIWETFRHNLVWESGLQCATQPISISGIYVNGTFKTPSDTVYGHYIDYVRGRVVFSGVISTSNTIKMEYSYKTLNFDRLTVYPEPSTLQQDSYNFNNYLISSSGEWSTLLRKQTPLVAVEIDSETSNPYSIGTGAQTLSNTILFHVFHNDDSMVTKICNLIFLQKEKTIYRVDFNLVATSGQYPLDYRGAKISTPKSYADLVNGGYRHPQLRFADGYVTGNQLIANSVYYGTVKFTTETISTV